MATKRQQEDMRLVYNALLTLSHCTDYGITRNDCEIVFEPDDLVQATASIYSFWSDEEVYQALAISEDSDEG